MTKVSDSKSLLPDWLSSLPAKTRRLLTSVGPWILSQSDEISKRYTKHQLRQAGVEILKQATSAEMVNMAEARKVLLLRIANTSDPTERVIASANLRHVEEEIRRFGICVSAFSLAQESRSEENSVPQITSINDVWLDRFDEFAKRQNEPWRRDLLAKALVKEAEQPGSIGTRALWLIGTMEEKLFHAFATILDLSFRVEDEFVIPRPFDSNAQIPGCVLQDENTIGHLTYLLGGTGLLGGENTCIVPKRSAVVAAEYGDKIYSIKVQPSLQIPGIIPSPLGNKLALLYEPKTNQLGIDQFEKWIKQYGDKAVLGDEWQSENS